MKTVLIVGCMLGSGQSEHQFRRLLWTSLWIIVIHNYHVLFFVQLMVWHHKLWTEFEVDIISLDLMKLGPVFVPWHFIAFLFPGSLLSLSMTSSGCPSLLFLLSVAPQEQEFLQKQQQELDGALKKIIQQHKLEIATIERDCLNHKQQLLRGKETEETVMKHRPFPQQKLLMHLSK